MSSINFYNKFLKLITIQKRYKIILDAQAFLQAFLIFMGQSSQQTTLTFLFLHHANHQHKSQMNVMDHPNPTPIIINKKYK